jgi:signal transduction histidine kinase/CheY-like chemotaxis protein
MLLRLWLERRGTFDVVAEAADGVAALDAARLVVPEVAVLDLAMPRMDGLEAAAEIRRLLPETRIVVRSGFSAERMAQKAIDAGADVYVEKGASSAELLAVLNGLVPAQPATAPDVGAVASPAPAPGTAQPSTYDLLLDALDAGVLVVDADTRVGSANFAATVILDVPTSRLVGSSLRDLLARGPDEGTRGADPVSVSLSSGTPVSGRVLRLNRSGGGAVWVSVDVRPFRGQAGVVTATGALVVVTDVTQGRELREALDRASERQAQVLDAVDTPIAVLRRPDDGSTGPPWLVIQANRAARSLTGWVVGSRLDEHDLVELGAPLRRTAEGEVVLAWSAAGARSALSAAKGVMEADRETAQTADLLEAAVISTPVGAVLLDGSARLVLVNPVADRLLGGALLQGSERSSRRLRWADTSEVVDFEDLPVRSACRGVPFDDVDLFVADEEDADTGTYVRISGRPVLGSRGEPLGAVISVLDDTARKDAERALAATHEELRRSNTELANFASVASHDLAQPLQNIYGFAQLLQDDGLEDPHAPDHLARIVDGCERMRTFLQDLLAYSRVTSKTHPFEEVDLDVVAREVVELFQQEVSHAQAEIRVDPLPTVLGDRVQMGQLLQNLIGNALTYVASGVRPKIHVHGAREGAGWRMTVDDNGIGIDPADRERAFAMFERLVAHDQYAGTGIGLAVCAKIVERHGGRIWIEDGPEGGTRIGLTLPARPTG